MHGESVPFHGLVPRRSRPFGAPAKSADLAIMRVDDFATLMKVVAAEDLWDDLAAALAARGCHSLRLSAEPMRVVSTVLRAKLAAGELTHRRLELARCGSSSSPGDDAGSAGAAGEAANKATRKPGDVIPVGESQPVPDPEDLPQ